LGEGEERGGGGGKMSGGGGMISHLEVLCVQVEVCVVYSNGVLCISCAFNCSMEYRSLL